MSTRLQVVLGEDELEEIREVARRRRMTVSDWVRQTLRDARQREPRDDADRKLAVIRDAVRGSYPTADIDVMLAEIEAGYGGTDPS
jgi:Arc/MetJ-type ribon-helix-helix transcriptional regulator